MATVIIYYLKPTADLFKLFDKTIFPLAKNYFLFVEPAGTTGEADVSDFTTFYASGLLNKERMTKYPQIDVYDPILLTQLVEQIIAPMRPIEVYYIQYPPMMFALTTPLAYFDLYTAWRIWFFVSIICIAITFLCIAYKSIKTRPLLLIGLLVYFANDPVAHNLSIGQTTTFEAAIIALSLRLLINKTIIGQGS